MASEQGTVTLTAHCLCKAHVFTASVPKSKLPLKASACHCDSCRHLTGALYSTDAQWPEPHTNVDISKLSVFQFSAKINVLFCGTCSTAMFFIDPKHPEQEFGVFTGTISNVSDEIIELTHHIFVGDTKDGGATMWLRRPNADATEAARYKLRSSREDAERISYDWPVSASLTGYEAEQEYSLPVRCKCKGVDFVWTRGRYNGEKKDDLPWFIDPTTLKPLAGFCGCDSCRLFSGVDLWTWTYSELKNLSFSNTLDDNTFPKNSSELRTLVDTKDPAIGTLAYYASSPDAQRYFCSNCSACIFYACDDRPGMVDIAIGVLEASDGARAEGFLSWAFGGTISQLKDSAGGWRHGLYERATRECEEWRIERGYPKNWRRVAREEAEKKGESVQ